MSSRTSVPRLRLYIERNAQPEEVRKLLTNMGYPVLRVEPEWVDIWGSPSDIPRLRALAGCVHGWQTLPADKLPAPPPGPAVVPE